MWYSDNLHAQSAKIGSNIRDSQEKIVILYSDWGNSFQDIREKEEALCLSCCWKRRKFSNEQGWHSGSHAYSVGCYYYICSLGFLRPSTKTWHSWLTFSLTINSLLSRQGLMYERLLHKRFRAFKIKKLCPRCNVFAFSVFIM